MSGRRLLSVVVPIYFEEELIGDLYVRLNGVLAQLEPRVDHEIVFVNDGSTDRSLELLLGLADKDRRVRVIDLSRNFGHQIAISAGIDSAVGDAVVVMDGDLQDPPEVIPEMLDRWEQGYQVVYGVRRSRQGETALKLWTAKAFYRLLSLISDTTLPLDAGDFRLMDRAVVDVFRDMHEETRYVRGMVAWVGFKQVPVEYDRDARYAGETKYTLGKMMRFALDGVLSFSARPLMLSAQVGAVITALSFLYAVFLVIAKIVNPTTSVPGWTTVLVVILLLGGVQMMSMGVLGAYLGRVFAETKRRPLYVVAGRYGTAPPTAAADAIEDPR